MNKKESNLNHEFIPKAEENIILGWSLSRKLWSNSLQRHLPFANPWKKRLFTIGVHDGAFNLVVRSSSESSSIFKTFSSLSTDEQSMATSKIKGSVICIPLNQISVVNHFYSPMGPHTLSISCLSQTGKEFWGDRRNQCQETKTFRKNERTSLKQVSLEENENLSDDDDDDTNKHYNEAINDSMPLEFGQGRVLTVDNVKVKHDIKPMEWIKELEIQVNFESDGEMSVWKSTLNDVIKSERKQQVRK